MAAKQYGGTGGYEVVWIPGVGDLITNEDEIASSETVTIAYEIEDTSVPAEIHIIKPKIIQQTITWPNFGGV